MRFVHPEILWLLLLLPLLVLLGWWTIRARRRALQRFAGGPAFITRFNDTVSVHRRAAKMLLMYVALACGITAAARPQWGTRLEQVTRGGADLVAVLDTSLSMAAEDVAPSRLDMARHTIDSLVKKLGGDRVALVTFAGRATLACPLTLDHAAVRLFLDAVDVESVPVAGTSLSDALRAAIRAFGEQEPQGDARSRAIILFTDGEDHEGGMEEILGELEQAGVSVYAVGVGTTRGAPIPLRDGSGASTGYKTDKENRVVTTRLDETVLEELALATGGRYYRATAGQVEIDEITRAMSALDTQEFGAVLRARYEERYQVPLALGLLALLAETVFGDRRKESTRRKESHGMTANPLIGVALLAAVLSPFGGSAHRKTESGNRHYAEGDMAEALRAYTEAQVDAPEAPELYYDIGNVLYRQGDYQGASEAYTRALLQASDDLVPGAAFNLGNARYEMQEFEEAVQAYERSLKAAPGDAAAKRNLELALRALELQQQQQQQQGDGEQGEQDQEQQSENQQGEDENKDSGDQQQQPQSGEEDEQQPEGSEGDQGGEDPQQMTPEQAARLLDSLSDQEQENLRRQLLQKVPARSKPAEKDW